MKIRRIQEISSPKISGRAESKFWFRTNPASSVELEKLIDTPEI